MLFRRMKVVLTRKLADSMDGINVAAYRVGDVLDLTASEARLLVAEQWATPERRRERGTPPAAERRRTNLQPAQDTLDGLESVV
jgi:hypothetical protein